MAKVFECNGQSRRQKAPGQLFQDGCSEAFLQAVGAGVPGGVEAAEEHCLLSTMAMNLKKNDTMCQLTPKGVFSLA